MTKQFLLLFTLLFCSASLWGQFVDEVNTRESKRGTFAISAGVGFPTKLQVATQAASKLFAIDNKVSSTSPYFMIYGEYRLLEDLGIGPFVGYMQGENDIFATLNFLTKFLGFKRELLNSKIKMYSFGGRLTIHKRSFVEVPELELYASTILGYNYVDQKLNISITKNKNINRLISRYIKELTYPSITYEVNAGGRYYFTDNFALFLEAGYGRFLVNAGVTYKFDKPKKRKRPVRVETAMLY